MFRVDDSKMQQRTSPQKNMIPTCRNIIPSLKSTGKRSIALFLPVRIIKQGVEIII